MVAFPKLFAIGTDYIKDIFNDEVEVTEKLDGSQFAFGLIGGRLYCRSKGKEQPINSPDKMFIKAVEYVLSIQGRLPEGYLFYGEYLQKPKHSTLAYDHIPKNHIALFGLSKAGKYMPYEEVVEWAHRLDLDVVPLIYRGMVANPEELRSFLEQESYLGGQKIEGVVVKRYIPWMLGSILMPLMGGKYVSDQFKEVHRETWKAENTDGGKWAKVIASFKSSARWHKAVMHLSERGELEYSPRDIGKLLQETKADIVNESKQEIMEQLWLCFSDQLLKQAVGGLPEWYKQFLLERSFDGHDISQ